MDGTQPVFTDSEDIKVWRDLCRLEKDAKKSSKGTNVLQGIIKKITIKDYDPLPIIKKACRKEGNIDPRLLSKMMFVADLYLVEDMKGIILELLEKCLISDSTLQVEAAEMLISKGAYDSARLILDRMTIVSNISRWEHIRGLIDIHDGNADAARTRFIKAYNADRSYTGAYHELERMDPGSEWGLRRRIASIEAATEPLGHIPSTPLEEVYDIYFKVNHEGLDNALRTLNESTAFQSGDRDLTLAAARLYSMDKEYQKSIECYVSLTDDPKESFSVQLELARTYVQAGMYDDAIVICDELSKICGADRRLMEIEIDAYAGLRDPFRLSRTVDMYLFNDYADLSAYLYATSAFIDASMNIEASNLISKMLVMHDDEAEIYYRASLNNFNSTRYADALEAASGAIKRDRNNITYKLQYAKISFATSHFISRKDRARRYIYGVLDKDPKNYDALILSKELREKDGNLDGALTICSTILLYYPRDADTLKSKALILDKLGRYDEALTAYREALGVKDDPVLFMSVIKNLAKDGRYSDAVSIINDYDDIYGNYTDTWVVKGNSLYASGEYMDAAESFEKATVIDKNNPLIWHSKGISEEMAGDFDNAEISYNKAVLLDLDNQDYWISKSAIQEKKGDYTESVKSLNRVIEMHPENTYALVRKAMILVRIGKVDEALVFVDMALRIDNNSLEIMRVKRDICIHNKDFEASVKVCKHILAKDKGDTDTMVKLAKVYMGQKMYREAASTLIDAEETRRNDLEILGLMRLTYHAIEDYKKESAVCKQILDIDPEDKDTMLALADAYVQMNMNTEASVIYDRLRTLMPQDSELALKKAKASEDAGTAMAILKESLENDPDNDSILMEISRIADQQGCYDEASEYAQRAVDANPKSSETHLLKARLLLGAGDPNGAIAAINTAIPLVETVSPMLWKYMGDAQESLADHENAMISYDTAIKLGMDDAEVYRERGSVQEKLGMTDAALNSYSLACSKDSDDVNSRERMAVIYLAEGDDAAAAKVLDEAINTAPPYGPILLMRAKMYQKIGDENGIKRIAGLSRIGLEESNGYRFDIEEIFSSMVDKDVEISEDSVDLFAVQLMNKAEAMNLELDDPQLSKSLNMTPEMSKAVLDYLVDIKECSNPGPDMLDFEKYESMSYKAVVDGDINDLEHDSLIPMKAAYFKTGAKSIDEAKRLISYVYAVMTSDIRIQIFDESIPEMVSEMKDTPDMSISDIMKLYHIGIYTAKVIKTLSLQEETSVI